MSGQPALVEMVRGWRLRRLHGAAEAGHATTFTSSQGLLLMIPNLYIMGWSPDACRVPRLHAWWHSMPTTSSRPPGRVMRLSCLRRNHAVHRQRPGGQTWLLSPITSNHLSGAPGQALHALFDGFRTSHEIQKIEHWTQTRLVKLMDRDALEAYHRGCHEPRASCSTGSLSRGPISPPRTLEANNLALINHSGHCGELHAGDQQDHWPGLPH